MVATVEVHLAEAPIRLRLTWLGTPTDCLGEELPAPCSRLPRAGLKTMPGLLGAWSPPSKFDVTEAPIRLRLALLGAPRYILEGVHPASTLRQFMPFLSASEDFLEGILFKLSSLGITSLSRVPFGPCSLFWKYGVSFRARSPYGGIHRKLF